MTKTRSAALAGLLVMWACGDSTGPAAPPPPPPPPPALLATGDWVGDWRFFDGDFFRVNTILNDVNGNLTGTCKFELQSTLPLFLACDRATGARSGDHTGGTVTATFDFTTIADGSFLFSGSLQPNVMSGDLTAGAGSSFSGYTYRPRGGSANLIAREAMPGSPEAGRLTRVLGRLVESNR